MEENNRYASFYIEDIHKNVIEQSCNPELLNNVCVNDKPDAPFDISPVYFSRNVLVKYLNDPAKYAVSDGEIYFKEEGFYLRVDTDLPEWVAVLLIDFSYLDYNEQLYWRAFNISPVDKHISPAAYRRWFEGDFAESIAPDTLLIQKYTSFYSIWCKNVGWDLFRVNPEDKSSDLFSLHVLSSRDNKKEFYEQILLITRIFVDSLNVKHFPKFPNKEENGSINRFSAYLNQLPFQVYGITEFLRNIQRLRSTASAHPGTIEPKVVEFFKIGHYSYGDILASIFIDMTKVLDTLIAVSCRIYDIDNES